MQIVNKGIYPKAGIQYARSDKHYTVFSWLVCETLTKPNIDFFLLARYTPALNKKFRLFTQIELVNAFPSASVNNFNFVQRIRLGFETDACQFGAGMDLTETGRGGFQKHIEYWRIFTLRILITMNIAIIGSGNVGGTLAQQWIKAGHTVLIGAKLPLSKKNIELAGRIGEDRFGAIPHVVNQCDVVLICNPPAAIFDILEQLGDLSDKVVIDATNSIMHNPTLTKRYITA